MKIAVKCPEGTELNPNPKKGQRACRKTCKKGEYRDEKTFNCVKNNTRKKENLLRRPTELSLSGLTEKKNVFIRFVFIRFVFIWFNGKKTSYKQGFANA